MFVDDRMAEFPAFTMDGTNTPDISEIRTRTPDPVGPGDLREILKILKSFSFLTMLSL